VGVSISGPTTLLSDETAAYTLTIDTALAGGAFNIAITSGSGTLDVLDANTALSSGELTHVSNTSGPPTGNVGDWSYDFTVTAPSGIGEMFTIAAVGMQFDGDFSQSAADVWNSAASVVVTVVPEPATGLLTAGGLLAMGIHRRLRRGAGRG
jgi:hypothetical protein